MWDPAFEMLNAPLFEQLPLGVLVWRRADANEPPNLRLVGVNAAASTMLKLDFGPMLGRHMLEIFPDTPQAVVRIAAKLCQQGGTKDFGETVYREHDGTKATFMFRMVGLENHTVASFIENLTALKRAEHSARQSVAELEAALAELDGFSYSVSHDLRAPVRAIDGFARILLEDHAAELSPEARRVAGVIAQNAVKMGALIDDLLQFARTSRQPVNTRSVDMTQLAKAAAEEVREPNRNLELRIAELPPALGDAPLLKQVWVNLLGNAVKYTRKREHAVIEVSGVREAREVTYTVKDNGVGFDARYAAKLFQVFQRLHSASEYEGTGVGLALVHRVLQRHGGRVSASATVGEGAAFVFTLPAAG
ncbi:MAG: hypothetical protein JNK82_34460 [Myxococcaceae bacterium]|nr:hypothetical protein [Myxococcaceae bacterium]